MKREQNIPRIVISAPHGQSGKTTVSIGLIGALVKSGLAVQPFKKGPDFIDPSWLSQVSGRLCRNLDCYLMDEESIRASVAQAGSAGAQIAVVEGAMGMFDGLDLEGSGSTAQIAKIIEAPVILVVNCNRMTRSVAPLVKGFKDFDPQVHVAGVILNNVARPRHQDILIGAIEKYCGLPVLGVIPKNAKFSIPNRHLGLVPAEENERLQQAIDDIVAIAQQTLDLKKIYEIAAEAPALPIKNDFDGAISSGTKDQVRVGIIKDRSFTFYYPENLESLERAGAELVYINALEDSTLPQVDALFIGGGFPEIFAEELGRNQKIRAAIAQQIEAGLPVYAECGGLMYLGRSIISGEKHHPMVGVLPFDVLLKNKPQGHGYTIMEVEKENPFFALHTTVKGHEFHNSCVVNLETSGIDFAFQVIRGHGVDGKKDGLLYKNVLACYNHIHALGTKGWAENLVSAASSFRKERDDI
ncbi:cobyrinate a,c-diamide synthase [Dehalobacterium formicoaceticum]|uniref:Cobyrinate a,c-diamide synthase n=1 Tax=Dehalobacterium formicoaceticum TaxID=51515 RepID=A0ABT1Y1Y8_9FIRM|nr:cobyrinate a,c-diamide synthase [Dehalobacterium formicoaceticum]MCR6544874.1 hydrogenobyrinic acid a,c-diamide synthase (glutamine-hydrolyzing) [Dehalobacterium formicoaceticum]